MLPRRSEVSHGAHARHPPRQRIHVRKGRLDDERVHASLRHARPAFCACRLAGRGSHTWQMSSGQALLLAPPTADLRQWPSILCRGPSRPACAPLRRRGVGVPAPAAPFGRLPDAYGMPAAPPACLFRGSINAPSVRVTTASRRNSREIGTIHDVPPTVLTMRGRRSAPLVRT